jgi:formiminoglutamase
LFSTAKIHFLSAKIDFIYPNFSYIMSSDSISLYFNPPMASYTLPSYLPEEDYIKSNLVQQHYSVAIIGVPDKHHSADAVRKHLYALFGNFNTIKICDLGNIKQGKSAKEMALALEHVVQDLSEKSIPCIVFGGDQWLTKAVFKALAQSQEGVSMCIIDSKIDVGDMHESSCSHSYLTELAQHPKLENLDIIGAQQYYFTETQKQFIRDHKGSVIRLSETRKDILRIEPTLRSADVVSIDMSAIRLSDAPSAFFPCPNGFTGEEMCQLSRYAGYADKTKALVISAWDSVNDPQHHTSLLVAEIMWHFLDGIDKREQECPNENNPMYTKLLVQTDIHDDAVVFYQNIQTDRWWIEIPTASAVRIMPCHLTDYQALCNNEIPEIWLRYLYK